MKMLQRVSSLMRAVSTTGKLDMEEFSKQLKKAAATQDLGELRAALEKSLAEAQAREAVLRKAIEALEAFETKIATEAQYSEAWWGLRRREIETQLGEDSSGRGPNPGMTLLARTFADAVVAGELDMCVRLGTHEWPGLAGAEEALELLTSLGRALHDRQPAVLSHLLERFARLAWPPETGPLLDEERQAAMLSLSARALILLGTEEAFDRALRRAQAAAARAPDGGLTHACLADVYRVRGDIDAALAEYQRALDAPEERPDTLIGLGLLAEGRDVGGEARDWYAAAAAAAAGARHPDRALGAMLFVVPAGAWFALAQSLSGDRPEDALAAADAALASELAPTNAFSASEAHKLRASLLEVAGRTSEAAAARKDAGLALYDEGKMPESIKELRSALDYEPSAPVYRFLADAVRIQSYARGGAFADPKLLTESLKLWRQGYELEPPPPDAAWAYTVGGLILEELGRQPRTTTSTQIWEAIGWLESGIAVADAAGAAGNEAAWIHLARLYVAVGLDGCALDAAAAAVKFATYDDQSWYWHAATLVNWGSYEEAAAALEEAHELHGATYDDIAVFLEQKVGDPAAARRTFDRMIEESETGEPDLWALDQRAFSAALDGDAAGARAYYEKILSAYTDGSPPGHQAVSGYAAYRLGNNEQARELLAGVVADPSLDDSTAGFVLGLCELRAGDLERGEATVEAALARNRGPRLLEEFHVDALDLAGDESLPEETRRAADRLVARLEDLREGQSEPSPERELKAALDAYGEYPAVSWAVSMALGRLRRAAGAWDEAAAAYVEAAAVEPGRSEPQAGKLATVGDLSGRARSLWSDRDPQGVELLAVCTEFAKRHLPGDTVLGARIAALEGAVRVLYGQREAGLELLGSALGDSVESGVSAADAARLGAIDVRDLWVLRNAFADLVRRADGTDTTAGTAAFKEAHWYAQFELGLLPTPYAPVDPRPVVRLGDGLIPDDTGEAWSLFSHHLPEMRAQLEADTGVRPPGVRFQTRPGDELFGYEIELDGVAQATGTVPVDGRSEDPIAHVVGHLDAVMRANLGGFVDLDVVEALLNNWSLDPDAARAVESLLPRRRDRIAFARLVRALVAERVSVADWRLVLEPLDSSLLQPGADMGRAVAAVREAFGDKLPGHEASLRRVALPREWVDEIAMALRGGPDRDGAGLPAALETLRAQLRSLPTPLAANAVLVAPDASSRTLVARLAAVLVPDVPVISQDELEEADGHLVPDPTPIAPGAQYV